MNFLKNRLLIFANDAASANVTMAYAYLNKNDFDEIIAFPIGVAEKIYIDHIKDHITCDKPFFLPSDTVVTGTSGLDSNYEMNIIKEAKKNKVKQTITIVDNIQNFNMRFNLNDKIVESKFLADEIWVFQKDFITNISSIQQKICYKKDIYVEFLESYYSNNIPIPKNHYIQKYQNTYLVILTEYIYEFYGSKFGFTEYEMLENILVTIDKLNLNIPIFLKLHPKEHPNKFNILLRKYSHLNILKDTWNIQELIYNSKLVFGINSSVFKECILFEKPTYSIQLNALKIHQPELLKVNSIVTTKDFLIKVLKDHFT